MHLPQKSSQYAEEVKWWILKTTIVLQNLIPLLFAHIPVTRKSANQSIDNFECEDCISIYVKMKWNSCTLLIGSGVMTAATKTG